MNALPKSTTDDAPNFRQLALEAIDLAGGDKQRAKSMLVDRFMADRELLGASLFAMATAFVTTIFSQIDTDRRRESPAMMNVVPNVVPIDGAAFNAAVRANFDRYMSRPAWGGKAVGGCTAAELRESADRYAKQGSSMIRESKWEFAVAEMLEKQRKTAEATVSQVLDESSLAILWDNTDVEF